jgi:hypothetical protein
MLEPPVSRYLERQAALAAALVGICTPMDAFVEAIDAYIAALEQPADASADAELLEGLRKQKEFFEGVREHFWEIGTSLSRQEAQPPGGDAFHALLHDFEPGEKEMN